MNRRTSLSVAALLLLPLNASARLLPDDPLARRCWLQFSSDRTAVNLFADSPPARLSNLRDGFQVRSPLVRCVASPANLQPVTCSCLPVATGLRPPAAVAVLRLPGGPRWQRAENLVR
jgi:hypothetical protein